MEALFWSKVSMCLMRQGPNGKRREELLPETKETPNIIKLRHIYYCLFSSENPTELAHNKKKLFIENDYEEHVVPHFHPYFEPLKPLLLRWWKILRIAHQFPIFEAVHDWIQDALSDSIQALKDHPSQFSDEAREVDEFREKDLMSLQYFPHNIAGKNKQSRGLPWELSPSHDSIPASEVLRRYDGSILTEPESPTPRSKQSKMQKMGD
jgi:hypothetical protein